VQGRCVAVVCAGGRGVPGVVRAEGWPSAEHGSARALLIANIW
jgi:hypothetical protein